MSLLAWFLPPIRQFLGLNHRQTSGDLHLKQQESTRMVGNIWRNNCVVEETYNKNLKFMFHTFKLWKELELHNLVHVNYNMKSSERFKTKKLLV